MTVTRKVTRKAAVAATTEEFQKSDHISVANSEEGEEEESTSDSEKRERDIADWIVRPRKPPLRTEDEGAEGKEEDVGTTQASTEDISPVN